MQFEKLSTKFYVGIDFALFILFNTGLIIGCLNSSDLAFLIWKITAYLSILAIIISILELMKKETEK